jgi:cytoskeletal protein RodZ
MKDNFKSRFSKERVAKFFDKEGFYIVLFVCVCIVAITAVWVSRTGLKNKENQSLEEPQEQTATNTPSQQAAVNNDEKVNIAESNDTNSSKPDNQNTATDKTTAANSKANTPVKTAAPPVIISDMICSRIR